MNGHVLQCRKESQNQQEFLKTVEALSKYISKNLEYPRDMFGLCKNYEVPTIAEPVDLTEDESTSETKKLIWKTKVQTFVKHIEAQEKTCK